MSTHNCPVVRVRLQPHPDADKLAIAVVDGYRCVVRKAEFNDGDLAVYVPPDYCVNTEHPAFAFLKGKSRITIRRFRGVVSDGLMLPLGAFPELADAVEGDNVLEKLGISRWEPEAYPTEGPKVGKYDGAPAPAVPYATVKYDIEPLKAWPNAFADDENVVVTEKIHGSNLRLVVPADGGPLIVGSRTRWLKRPAEGDPVPAHFACLTPEFEYVARTVLNRGVVYYGEVYGASVQGAKFAYDASPGTARARLFWAGNGAPLPGWAQEFSVPVVASGSYGHCMRYVEQFLSNGMSIVQNAAKNQTAEGVVISSLDRPTFYLKGNLTMAALKAICPKYYEVTG